MLEEAKFPCVSHGVRIGLPLIDGRHKHQMSLHVQLLDPNVPLPRRQTEGSGGYDVHSRTGYIIPCGERECIDTGIAVKIPDGHVGILKTRSSMALKCVDVQGGVIDSDYTGEIKVILSNASTTDAYHVKAHQRIAQLLVIPVFTGPVSRLDSLDATKRGSGGFGSTGA